MKGHKSIPEEEMERAPVPTLTDIPTSFDWRDYGAVTDVRRQGDCGACWAITAVETIEAAYFLGTNSLLDLSETEVIRYVQIEEQWQSCALLIILILLYCHHFTFQLHGFLQHVLWRMATGCL